MALDPRFRSKLPANQNTWQTLSPTSNNGNNSNSPVKRGMDIFSGTEISADMEDFIGQERAKNQIKLAISSAKARGTRLGHTLLATGTPGAGKTTLGKLIAFEMGAGLLETTGPLSQDEGIALLRNLSDGDILMIDEAHTLGKKADWLLSFMTEGQILTAEGPEKMPDVTVICCTTHSSKLADALLSRFEVKPRLEAYSDDESAYIAEQMMLRMDVWLDFEQCKAVGLAGNNNPRNIRSIMTILRDMQATGAPLDLDVALDYAGVTKDGLDMYCADVLLALLGTKNNTASQSTIGAIVGESENIAMTEKTLLAKGFIEVSRSGRTLTREGVQRARSL